MRPGHRRIFTRVLLGLLLVLALMTAANWELVTYALRQGKGQLHIIWHAKPVEYYLTDPGFPDSLKQKLLTINRVRKFAIDSLGLKDTENYKTLFDQKGKEVMWVVMASEPFRLRAKEWDFPVIGSVPYKGFFEWERAIALRNELEKEGWDVNIRNPGGWSTLGWFTDPILSGMLDRSEGDLASLIIHEMAHATIFVKDSIDFNENLATFIGDRGAEQFLIAEYGESSEAYRTYMNEDRDFVLFADHMLRGAEKLDSLYATMKPTDPIDQKTQLKQELIRRIVVSLDTLSMSENNVWPSKRYEEKLPNNAYFLNFQRYQSRQDVFDDEWKTRFNGNLRAYIRYLSEKYPFL